jgi:acetyltransferase
VLDRAASTALLATYGIELADDELPRAAPDMLELALLLQPDPVFGPVLVLDPTRGPGDGQCQRAVGLPPLNRRLARSMIERAGIDPQFGSAYGAPETVLEPLELVICKLAQMAGELDGLAELALDPLLALPGRAFATRALVRLGPPEPPAAERLAIRPYPVELERAIRLMDGTTAWLRPIRPEDEAALRRFVAALTPEDVASRFFSPLKELDHQLAARLTQLDYDREMALVLLERAPDGSEGPIMGVGRLMADPGRRSAEYALTVRSDLKGRGLGRLLLEQVLACARERGLEEVWGSVLAHNGPMLGLVRKLGFTVTRDPDDPEIIKTVWRPAAAQSLSSSVSQ